MQLQLPIEKLSALRRTLAKLRRQNIALVAACRAADAAITYETPEAAAAGKWELPIGVSMQLRAAMAAAGKADPQWDGLQTVLAPGDWAENLISGRECL